MRKPLRTVLSYIHQDQLPPDWGMASVGDVVFDAQYGMNAPSAHDGATPIVGMKDIREGRVLFENLARTTVSDDELETYRLRGGDLLINRTNSLDQVGKVGIVDADRDIVFASYLVRLTSDRSKIDPQFLNLWLNCDIAQRTIKRIATPAIGQANLNPTEFQKYCLVPLPSMADQRRIVEILCTWEKAIQASDQLVASKEKQFLWLSRALLFGGFRLENPKTTGRHEHRWFSLPKDWMSPRISEIAQQANQVNTPGEKLTVLSCTKHDGLVKSLAYFGRQVFSADTSAYKIVERGQFAYATNHLEEGSIGYLDFCDKALISPMYTVFKTDSSKVNDRFLLKVFKTSIYLHIFQANTSASVDRRGGLRWDEFGKIRVPLPELAEQARIDSLLSSARREIDVLKAVRKNLDRQRRGLTQKLLTGKWRVPQRDEEVETAVERSAEEVAQ